MSDRQADNARLTGAMTTVEAALRLNVSTTTVRKLIRENGLPAVRVGRQIRIPRDEFQIWYRNLTIELAK